jgi:hypothetical protein
MSVISHHFQQQRKVVAPSESLKAQLAATTPPADRASPSITTSSSSAAPTIAQLAKEARQGTIGWESEADEEVLLRKFDMNLSYGSCTGVTRLQRWERAQQNGLQPPQYIKDSTSHPRGTIDRRQEARRRSWGMR